jgi:DnaJ-domain-containing protein 1
VTLMEGGTVIVGLFAGYWFVSKLFSNPAAPVKAAETPARSDAWHQVLNVDPTANVEEIHGAYRRLISQYHPDKVEHLGPELKELAARKAQEITVAYQAALAAKGTQA